MFKVYFGNIFEKGTLENMRLVISTNHGSHVSIITDPIARYKAGQYSFKKSFMTLSANL